MPTSGFSGNIWFLISGESRIIFLPERSSICQYPPKISAINIKKQSRARLLLAHPVLCILKIQKTCGTFWKPPFQNQPKSVRRKATYGKLHYLRKWFRQCNLSNLSSLFNTSYYSLLVNTVFGIYIPWNSKPGTNTLHRLQGPRLF